MTKREEFREAIQANVERSRESLQAAKELVELGHPDFAASRAYYAAFYAATALQLSRGKEFARHSGVISSIHRDFVHAGELSEKAGEAISSLFEYRKTGDYGLAEHVSDETAREAVALATAFVDEVLALTNLPGKDTKP